MIVTRFLTGTVIHLAEVIDEPEIYKALKIFKRLAKKLSKNLKNFNPLELI